MHKGDKCITSECGDSRNQKKGYVKTLSDLGFDHETRFVALHGSTNVVDQNQDPESAQPADRIFNKMFDDLSDECNSTIKENIKAKDFWSVLDELIKAKEELALSQNHVEPEEKTTTQLESQAVEEPSYWWNSEA
ncbi:unnamed protein product [Cochlearia groenlandica]